MNLQARNLSIGYRNRLIGNNIDFSLAPGEVVCLLGPNGCGKTTLFKTLLGLIPAIAGTVTLSGKSLSRLSRRQIARQIAYVPQSHAPPFPFTAIEIVLMACTPRLGLLSRPAESDVARARKLLEKLGLDEFENRDYSRLSGGQRQLILVARALFQDSRILIMDEPSSSLDFGNQARVMSEIAGLARKAKEDGVGVVFSTHNPDQALLLNARVVLMQSGQVLANGMPRDILTAENLSRVYRIPIQVEQTGSGRPVCVAQFESSN